MEYDVLIIGAGVVGALAARELSKYQLKICVVEKETDIAMGATKANSAIIHAGYDPEPGSLKALLNVRGNILMESLCAELKVPFKKIGSLVVGYGSKENEESLLALYGRGIKNGVKGLSILNKTEIKELEPLISDEVTAALYAQTTGIICPYELAIAAIENAYENGVSIITDCRVTGIKQKNGVSFDITTTKGIFSSRYIINAAGAYADVISRMVGEESFNISPRKGEYLLLDKNQGSKANTVVFQLPTKQGKGILVAPTAHGNLLLGPTAVDIKDKEDTCVSSEGILRIKKDALRLFPYLSLSDVITSFSGIRAVPSTGDFVINASKTAKGFINAAGIESPGLTASPAIAEYIRDLLSEEGLLLINKEDFNPIRDSIYKFNDADNAKRAEMIEKDAAYGRIICRCEKVTEGEIIDAIRRCPGVATLDAVKRRARTGMGRCQGGFCTPRVLEILARELGVPVLELTKSGGASKLLYERTK